MADNEQAPPLFLTFRDLLKIQMELVDCVENASSMLWADHLKETLARIKALLDEMETPRPGRSHLPIVGIIEVSEGAAHG